MTKERKYPVARSLSSENTIKEAIKSREVITFQYDGKARIFAPHILFTSANDKVCAGGAEIASTLSSVEEENFKNFEVGRISYINKTGSTFRPLASFSSSSDQYKNGVLCAVDGA